MPAKDAVATLNRMGGKSSPTRVRSLRPRLTGLFPPENEPSSRRSSGRLQKRGLSQSDSASVRRNSLSLPEYQSPEVRPKPAGKTRKRTALKKSNPTNQQSPLKKHGYDIEIPESLKVNLNDSPAKRTRSKAINPLETLAKVKLPTPTASEEHKSKTTPKKRTFEDTHKENSSRKRRAKESYEGGEEPRNVKRTRVGSDKQQPEPEPEQASSEAEVEAEAEAEAEAGEVGSEQEEEHEAAEDGDDGGDDGLSEPGQESDEQGQRDQIEAPEVEPPGEPQAGAEPDPRSASNEEDQEVDRQKRKRIADAQEQRAERMREEEEQSERYRERFVLDIQKLIQQGGFQDHWKSVGGAAYTIRSLVAQSATAKSDRGKTIIRDMKQLSTAYRARRKQESSINTIQVIQKLNDHCGLLKLAKDPAANKTVKDIFMHLIPAAVFLLRTFLRTAGDQSALNPPQLLELDRLLEVVLKMCKVALDWYPRPTNLDSGVRKWVRNDIGLNLKRIKDGFESAVHRYERILADRHKTQVLAEKQAIAHQKLLDAVNETKQERRMGWVHMNWQSPRLNRRQISRHVDSRQKVHDIDDLEAVPLPLPSTEPNQPLDKLAKSNGVGASVPQLRREPTVELPPPLSIDLSEDEKTALLNGLQIYTGEDRYSEILDDPQLGDILKARDLDDLVQAARSYSRIMTSKMGLEAYRADASLEWLRSTDPDI